MPRLVSDTRGVCGCAQGCSAMAMIIVGTRIRAFMLFGALLFAGLDLQSPVASAQSPSRVTRAQQAQEGAGNDDARLPTISDLPAFVAQLQSENPDEIRAAL